jgi:hypothetical protein
LAGIESVTLMSRLREARFAKGNPLLAIALQRWAPSRHHPDPR